MKHRHIICWKILLSVVLCVSGQVWATEITPFDVTNYNPLQQLYGLPLSTQTALLESGQQEFKLVWDRSSYFTFADSPDQHIMFDGESNHTTFIYNHSPRAGLQWGIVIPYVSHSGGSLDNFIINWHKFFGFPQGGRDQAPRNRLRLYYQRNGVTLLNITQPSDGIGDVRLTAGWRAPIDNTTFNASLKLPTGDSAELHGSGAADLALWMAGNMQQRYWDYPGAAFASLGVMFLGSGDVLPDQQRSQVLFGGVGTGLVYNEHVRFKVQLDMHSPMYNDIIGHSNSIAVQCTMGGTIQFTKDTKLDLGVSEDFNVDASPDVNFHLGLQRKF